MSPDKPSMPSQDTSPIVSIVSGGMAGGVEGFLTYPLVLPLPYQIATPHEKNRSQKSTEGDIILLCARSVHILTAKQIRVRQNPVTAHAAAARVAGDEETLPESVSPDLSDLQNGGAESVV